MWLCMHHTVPALQRVGSWCCGQFRIISLAMLPPGADADRLNSILNPTSAFDPCCRWACRRIRRSTSTAWAAQLAPASR
jgi:hypothetical protein